MEVGPWVGDAGVLVTDYVLEGAGPRRRVRCFQRELRLGASVASEDAGGAHGDGEEPKDGVAAVELDGAASVACGGVLGEARLELLPSLLVETSEVAVLELVDGVDVEEVLEGAGDRTSVV